MKKHQLVLQIILSLTILLSIGGAVDLSKIHAAAPDLNSTNYINKAPSINEGGCTTGTKSTSYQANCSTGQYGGIGSMSSTNFIIKTGFQYYDYGFGTPYVSFSMNKSSLNLGTLLTNSFSTGTSTVTITTNAIYGYNLYVQENHDLQNNSNSSVTIPSFTGSSTTTAASWTNPTTNGLGYNISGSDKAADFTSSSMYRAFDSSAAHIIALLTSPTQTTGGDTTTITYQLSPSPGTSAGTYTNSITYTVVGVY